MNRINIRHYMNNQLDEINRGNISKVFGELLMLIEADKRSEENSVFLPYTGERFYVPNNIYIIGTMNTADRSLAMIDYALRRRFCFFRIKPAFETKQFSDYLKSNGVSNSLISKINERFISLNKIISDDQSLKDGFCIGHSYFCNCKNTSEKWYEDIIRYEIEPLLNEYWYDDEDKAKECIEMLLK